MKKFLSFIGALISSALSVALVGLIIALMVVINLKSIVKKGGITDILNNINIVDVINDNKDLFWDDFEDLAEDMNLTTDQLEQMLESDVVKGELAEYISDSIASIFGDKDFTITKENLIEFVNTGIDEYNKVSDKDISESQRKEIIDSINQDVLDEFNDALNFNDLREELYGENANIMEIINKVVFDNAVYAIVLAIIIILALIALFRFSWYKWMYYAGISSFISGVLLIIATLFISSLKAFDINGNFIVGKIVNVVSRNMFIASIIAILSAVVLFIIHAIIKKIVKSKKANNVEEIKKIDNSKKEEAKETKQEKNEVEKSDDTEDDIEEEPEDETTEEENEEDSSESEDDEK